MSRILKFEVPPGKPVLRGQDHYWSVIREVDELGPWGLTAIMARSKGVDRSTIREYVTRLVTAGIAEIVNEVERANSTIGSETGYRLLRSPLTTPRPRRDGTVAVQGRGQIQMWNVIRGPIAREGFTFKDVAMYGSTEDVQVAVATASKYVQHLAQAGYLLCVRKGGPGRPATWRIKPAMNTGPKPPLILRTQIVFDQNRGEAIGPVVAREVEA